jgi:ketosteroid isomerase-like protein
MPDRLQTARDSYTAYETGDRRLIERLLSDGFVFYSPPDPGLDRDQYFQVCWPNHGRISRFDYLRLFEHGDEVVVTYEATRTDGTRFRNTEILTFDGDRICRAEVYFGWEL